MNVELGDRVELERQNEKSVTHLQKLIYTSNYDARAEHIIKNNNNNNNTWTVVLSSNNVKKLLPLLL